MTTARNIFVSKKAIPFIIGIIIILGIALWAKNIVAKTSPSSTDTSVQKPIASQTLNKTFAFPIKDSNDKEVTKIKYSIDSAELRKQIIVKGQRADAVNGKVFLIINVKITNDYDKAIQTNVRDFIRLSVNGNTKEWLAPEIHNDPVDIRPISTKYTRIGFAINETDKKLALRVGEINGTKQTIDLNLK